MLNEPAFFFDVVRANGRGPTIYLRGEIDMATCERLRDALEPHVGPQQTITVDLDGIEFMDSSCLNVFAQTHRSLRADGGALILRNPSEIAQRVLAITGLEFLLATATNAESHRVPS